MDTTRVMHIHPTAGPSMRPTEAVALGTRLVGYPFLSACSLPLILFWVRKRKGQNRRERGGEREKMQELFISSTVVLKQWVVLQFWWVTKQPWKIHLALWKVKVSHTSLYSQVGDCASAPIKGQVKDNIWSS